jgi:SAM-dependent methyltransferase
MAEPIRFDDSAAYEQSIGTWSRLTGDAFLAWLAPASGQRWLDVGCGTGAFSARIVHQCAPAEVQGLDLSVGQVTYAHHRLPAGPAHFLCGDVLALPYHDAVFDLAVMALVLFFLADPAKGLAEMQRVVRPGGVVASYAWDVLGGGFPADAVLVEMRAMGLTPPQPPHVSAAGLRASTACWAAAGLQDIATHVLTIEHTFANFAVFWATCLLTPGLGPTIKAMAPRQAATLQAGVRARLAAHVDRALTCPARVNAIKGWVPG